MPEEKLAMEFGSLHSALHETRIDQQDFSDGSNWNSSEGILRLDDRYTLFHEEETEDVEGYGVGYAKYIGEDAFSEQLAFVIGNPDTGLAQLIQYDLTDNDAGVEQICDSMANNDWFFQQYKNFMYVASEAGLIRYELKANPGSVCSRLEQPTAPPTAPGVEHAYPSIWARVSWAGSSITASGSASTAYDSGLDSWNITYSSAGRRTVQIDFDTSPNLKPDLSYHDLIQHFVQRTSTVVNIEVSVIQDGVTYKLIDWMTTSSGGGERIYNRLHNIARENRDAIESVIFEFDTPSGSSFIKIYAPYYGLVWLSCNTSDNPGNNPHPPFSDLLYAYTRYDSSTGFESELSPVQAFFVTQQNTFGDWLYIRGRTDAEGGVDKWRYYRGRTVNGVTTYYRLTEVNADHLEVFLDKYPRDEIEDNETYQVNVLPSSGFTAITTWQNRLWLAAGSIVYGSRFDRPLEYESIDGPDDPFSEAQGLTFYPDDRRAEEVLSLLGQDDLYIVTNFSVRALLGNSPLNWRLIKLPDIEGACGRRAACAYKKGVLVLTPSGRLMYHHTSLIEPEEVSVKVRERAGDPGISALATADAVVAVYPSGEIEVRNGQDYYILATDGRWRKGTYSDSAKDLLYISGQPRRFLGSAGKLFEAGGLVDNETEVEYSVTTKKFRGNVQLTNVYVRSSSQVKDDEGRVRYPRISISSDRGTFELALLADKKNTPSGRIPPNICGYNTQFTLIGNKDVEIHECELTYEVLDEDRHL